MQKINLRELYPDMYKTDTFLEVTDEVQAVFLSDKRAEAAHERQMYRYKAQYSLDCDNGIEDAVVQPDAADLALSQQVIGRVAADAQHSLQILDRYNVRVLRKHELVHFSDFFTIHSITILEF